MHVMKFHAFHAFYILSIIQNMCFWAFFRQKTDKIGQFKKIGGDKGRKSVNYLKIKEELICRNSPNKKRRKSVNSGRQSNLQMKKTSPKKMKMTSHKNGDNLTPRNEDDLRQKCLLYS